MKAIERPTQTALLALLRYGGSDPLLVLARCLAATRLNLAAGANAAIAATAAQVDSFLAQHPPGATVVGADLTQANHLSSALAAAYGNPCPLACVPQPLGTANGFDLFVLGNLNQSGSDTEGRMARVEKMRSSGRPTAGSGYAEQRSSPRSRWR